jgi:hypothetical protein
MHIHPYVRFVSEGVAEIFQIHRDDLVMRSKTGGKPITIVSAVKTLVAFYDIHGRKGEMLFYSSVPDTTHKGLNIL